MSRKRKEPKRKSIGVMLVWLGVCAACLLLLPTADQVNAHSWYPQRCCGGQDCRKIDKIDFLPDGGMVMHVGYMEVVVPRNFVLEVSEDADAHVCVSIATGTYRPVCVFMPGTS
jgi:hypothetical protein